MRKLLLALLWLVPATAAATTGGGEAKNWSLEVGADAADSYLFRGLQLLGEARVWVPRARLAVGDWSIAYFGYSGEIPGAGDYLESDLSLDYTVQAGRMSFTAGALTYQFNGDAERDLAFFDTHEVYVIARWNGPLTPTVSYYQDIDAVDGGYANLGASHAWRLAGDRLRLVASAAVGFDFGYNLNSGLAADRAVAESNGQPSDLLFGADLVWQATESVAFHGLVQRSIALQVLDDIGQRDVTVITFGLSRAF